ncbi:hypothetical protein P8935_22265 [Telmatobacter sp. DSM 110680]|uniref:Glycosyl hydrolase 94 catalytic domain-containing protein n=1 Tax=Telmatobacter sp. DSM 110680 TaxID=3036704 RepID=A0AAU7DQF7_9BACT
MAESESVLNSAMAAWVFDEYARLLDYSSADSSLATEVRANADRHREATRSQWNGKWFKRAWLGPKLGWLGDTTLWIEPQPWAILSGATTPTQTSDLLHTINDQLRLGPLGAAQMSDGPDMRKVGGTNVGTLELGAIWPSLNQTLVWALARTHPATAWEEWKRNSLACHAEAYPDIWYGVWIGNDSYNSPLSKHPGGAANEPFFHGTDFPVLNLHSHACFLYSASKLLGMEFTPEGMAMNLEMPVDSYSFRSPLVGVVMTKDRVEGWYAPSRPGNWKLRITLPASATRKISRVEVNEKRTPVHNPASGMIEIAGESTLDSPLRWSVIWR